MNVTMKIYNHIFKIAKNNLRVILLLFLILLGTFLSPRFLSGPNIRNILFQISLVGFLAIGQTILMISNEIDLSLGSLMAFAPITAIILTENLLMRTTNIVEPGNLIVDGLPFLFIVTILTGMLVGIIIGIIRVKLFVPSLIITLGLLYGLRGGAYVLSGGQPYYMTMLEGFAWLGETDILFFPVSFIIWILVSLSILLVINYTKLGNVLYAIGGNEEAARFSGIDVEKWKVIMFAFSGICGSITALIYSSRLAAIEATQGSGYELTAVAIAVIGGATIKGGEGSIKGMIVGTFIFGVLLNLISIIGLVDWYNEIMFGAVIIGAAFLYKKA